MTIWRNLAIGIVAGLVVDFVAAAFLLQWTGANSDNRLEMAFILVGLVWAVQLYAAIKSAALVLAIKNTSGAKAIAAQVAKEGFPPPEAHDDVGRYLARIANDVSLDDHVRLRASFYQGEIASMGSAGFARSYALARTWEQALTYLR